MPEKNERVVNRLSAVWRTAMQSSGHSREQGAGVHTGIGLYAGRKSHTGSTSRLHDDWIEGRADVSE